jgi:hypothetical protein
VGIYVDQLRRELADAGIHRITCEDTREGEDPRVEGRLYGRDGEYVFTRGWFIWKVEGPISLCVAGELLKNPENDVHLARFREGSSLVDFAGPDDEELREKGLLKDGMSVEEKRAVALKAGIQLWVTSLQIFSYAGLEFFVKTLRERGLINQDQS